jgi:hypothetical protein
LGGARYRLVGMSVSPPGVTFQGRCGSPAKIGRPRTDQADGPAGRLVNSERTLMQLPTWAQALVGGTRAVDIGLAPGRRTDEARRKSRSPDRVRGTARANSITGTGPLGPGACPARPVAPLPPHRARVAELEPEPISANKAQRKVPQLVVGDGDDLRLGQLVALVLDLGEYGMRGAGAQDSLGRGAPVRPWAPGKWWKTSGPSCPPSGELRMQSGVTARST